MFKTFIKRWYITNRLYHYLKSRDENLRWAEQGKFIAWFLGTDLDLPAREFWDKNGDPVNHKPKIITRIILYLFFDSKTVGELWTETDNTIQECSHESVGLLKSINEHGVVHINLTTLGRSHYSFSYIIFKVILGNAYVKGIILSGLAVFTGYYINNHILKLAKDNNEPIKVFINSTTTPIN